MTVSKTRLCEFSPEQYKDIEWKASIIYSSLLKDPNAYLKKELRRQIIKK